MLAKLQLPGPAARKLRKGMFFIHLWLGALLGLWLALVGGSGSLLAWLPELISFEMRARHPHEIAYPGQPQIPLSRVLTQLKQAIPDLKPGELASVTIPNERFPFYLLPVRRDGGMVYKVDPYSGTVHPPYRKSDLVIGTIANFHEMLLLGPKGFLVNGVGASFAVLMLLSGLWLWWPNTWKQLRLRLSVKRGGTLRRILMDLHNVFGAYLYVILFVSTVTAGLLAFNRVTEDGIEKAVDRRADYRERKVQVTPDPHRLEDDALVALARQAVPELPVVNVRRAVKPGEPFEANFIKQGGFLNRASVALDPHTGAVLKLERGTQASPGHQTIHLMEDLHFGFYGGVVTKLIYTFAGLMPLALFVTGMGMWWNRKQAEHRSAARAPRRKE